MATVTVRVAQKHIDEGERSDVRKCPIALACQEATGRDVMVVYDYFVFDWDFNEITGGLLEKNPDWIQKKMHEFDSTGKMDPFEFSLNVPYLISG